MSDEARRPLDDYLQAADSWAVDREEALARSRTIAWRVAAGACLVAVLEALALVALTPLKTVVPYTLLVDRHTGYVEALKPLDKRSVSADAALTRSFLAQYVIAREGFAIESVQNDYRKVALWSAGEARAQYVASMQPSNPASPLAAYPRSTIVQVVIKSVSSLSPDTVLVRFDTQRDDRGQATQTRAWAAVARFTYAGEPMSVADRLLNPLGFKVVRYSRSEEAPPEPPAPTIPATPQYGPSASNFRPMSLPIGVQPPSPPSIEGARR
ncbi:MAG TPA: VirB8/TrbF family protein [Caulobacteraceae bacterium]|jgi:type IV secretion system protein VirB8|nr:VirB8/TrbF family protein [Caulobacteraceae bacterium]